ncbi:MAG: FAD-binding protein [Candidatus Hydrogenedentes bacterium]|nr:FAD-binding protein [Candidatus Hydrogenedentota bacterium]
MAKLWKNWSGRVSCSPAQIAYPRDEAELAQLVRTAAARGQVVRPVGSGHSFSDLVTTTGVVVSLDKLAGLIEVDKVHNTATAWAGTKLWQFCDLLAPFNLAMENMGDIDKQSLGGALATGTHGTGLGLGGLSTQISALSLMTASGEVIECSEEHERDIFKAAQVSVGALGIVTQFTLRVVPTYRLAYTRAPGNFIDCISRAQKHAEENRHFEFWYFPYTDTVMMKFHIQTEARIEVGPVRKWIDEVLVENYVFGVLAGMCRRKPSRCAALSKFTARRLTSASEVNTSHHALVTRRILRFSEMEYAIPIERGPTAMRELKEWIVKENAPVFFPIEYRYVKADDIWLSPFYQRDSVTISVHYDARADHEAYFRGAEKIFRRHGGRPHWGKIHYLSAAELRELYPEWDSFRRVRKALDPRGVFLNPHLAHVLGG